MEGVSEPYECACLVEKKNREMKLNEYRPPEWEQKEELEKVGMNRGDWVHEN